MPENLFAPLAGFIAPAHIDDSDFERRVIRLDVHLLDREHRVEPSGSARHAPVAPSRQPGASDAGAKDQLLDAAPEFRTV